MPGLCASWPRELQTTVCTRALVIPRQRAVKQNGVRGQITKGNLSYPPKLIKLIAQSPKASCGHRLSRTAAVLRQLLDLFTGAKPCLTEQQIRCYNVPFRQVLTTGLKNAWDLQRPRERGVLHCIAFLLRGLGCSWVDLAGTALKGPIRAQMIHALRTDSHTGFAEWKRVSCTQHACVRVRTIAASAADRMHKHSAAILQHTSFHLTSANHDASQGPHG